MDESKDTGQGSDRTRKNAVEEPRRASSIGTESWLEGGSGKQGPIDNCTLGTRAVLDATRCRRESPSIAEIGWGAPVLGRGAILYLSRPIYFRSIFIIIWRSGVPPRRLLLSPSLCLPRAHHHHVIATTPPGFGMLFRLLELSFWRPALRINISR